MVLSDKKRDLLYRCILLIIPIVIIVVVLPRGEVYGSMTDWLSQHTVFPDYFRKMFYASGDVFPNFSLNLGGGQNFAQYTYYGLMRPDILISYLLPQISMVKIIIVSSVAYLLISIQLLYQWLKNQKLSEFALVFASIMYALACPLIFHSHRHLMFISYMPGLMLCLIGTDRYIKLKKTGCLLVGVLLMVITSYFFSVGGLLVVGLYGIYAWMMHNPTGNWKQFALFISKYIGFLLLGVLLSAFYLIPTAYAMILQTRPALDHVSMLDLLLPKTGLESIFYDEYNIGLTAIAGVALCYGIVKKHKPTQILSVFLLILTCVPLVAYLLNGMQYVRAKSLIPFIPLFILLIASMMDDLKKRTTKFPWWIFIILAGQYFLFDSKNLQTTYIKDLIICVILFLISTKFKFQKLMILYLLVPAYICFQVNISEDYPSKSDLRKVENSTKTRLVKDTIQKNPGLYRFDDYSTSYAVNRVEDVHQYKTTQYSSNSNIDYNQFYYNVMKQPMNNRNHVIMAAVDSPYFSNFMGVRFAYTDGDYLPYGYHAISNDGDKTISEDESVLPVAYVSSNIVSNKDFAKLSWPYTMETLYMNTIVDKSLNQQSTPTSIQEIHPAFTMTSKSKGLKVKKTKNGMQISCKEDCKMVLKLKTPLPKDQLLILQTTISDIKEGLTMDTEVRINGINNKKTARNAIYASPKSDFEYVIGETDGVKKLYVTFSQGTYTLKDFKFYTSDANRLKQRKQQVDALQVQDKANHVLAGKVQAKDDGYFVTSIPYQKGFTITVDGKAVDYEPVNTAFVGFPISKGEHRIDMTYEMPGKGLGLIASGVALLMAGGIWLYTKKQQKHRKD